MLSHKERPSEIKINHIYLTSIETCWQRIKVIEMSDKEANCICIDNGDIEWLPFNDIFVCKPDFMVVPAQAFKLSLYELEEFENDPNATQPNFFEPLIYKSLVGEVMMNQKLWDLNKSKPIKMILYDTSTEDDINLNEMLSTSILKSVPKLNEKDSNQVIITHIGEDGIYCQLSKTHAYVQQLLKNITKDNIAQYKIQSIDKLDKSIYLVYNEKSKAWLRARVEKLIDNNTVLMYMIDHGYKFIVKPQNIYCLEKFSFAMYKYHPQVIKIGLFKVTFTDDVRKRLLGMLPIGHTAIVSCFISLLSAFFDLKILRVFVVFLL